MSEMVSSTCTPANGMAVEFLGLSEWRGQRLGDMSREQLIRTCCEMGDAMRQERERFSRERERLFDLIRPEPQLRGGFLLLLGLIAAGILVQLLKGCA